MQKIKTLPILAVLVLFSFLGVRPVSAATCTLTFDPPTVNAGTASELSWNITGSFVSAKLGCVGPNYIVPTDVTDYVGVPGSIPWATDYVGTEKCSLYLDDSSTATCVSNTLFVETDAICTSLNFNPTTVNAGEKSVLSWNVVDGSFNKALLSCDGPNGFDSTDVTAALKLNSQGSADWPTSNDTGTDFCTLMLDSDNIISAMMFAHDGYCISNNLTIGSGSEACGSLDQDIIPPGTNFSSYPDSDLCPYNKAVIRYENNSTWCGKYLWSCEGSTTGLYDCEAFTQGECGSVDGTTVASGTLTKDSPNLCVDNKPSDFDNTGTAYTWKCGKGGCDQRTETSGVVSCNASIIGGGSTPKIECSFNPETITAGGTTVLSYDATINGGISKVTVTGTGIFEQSEADLPALSSDASTVVNTVGSGSAIFKGYDSANLLVDTCTASLTVNQGGGTIPTATVSVSAAPASVEPGGISYITWTSQNASTMEVECTGPVPIARGGIQTTSVEWQAAAAAAGTYNPPAGTPDGFPATFTEVSSTPEVCTFYPYGSDGKLGTPKSVTITIADQDNCECNMIFSPVVPCPTGKSCDGCHCVTCTANCTCETSTCVGSTCSDGCGGTCAGKKTDGVCVDCSTWSLTLGATPTSGQAPLTVNLIATTQQTMGGETYSYSEHSCGSGGPAATNVNGKNFTCVYPTAGTYQPSIKVTAQSTGCVKNASVSVTVNAASGYSCTGSIPSGSTMCANDNTGLTATLPWQSVGTSASSCTETRKCEYYTSSGGTCGGIDVWTAKGPTLSWNGVAMSSDGKIQTAAADSDNIYVSIDSGNTWSPKDSNRLWYGVAMSSDGKIQTAVPLSGQLYVSTDSGNTWTAKDSNRGWRGIAMSSDGKFQTATVYGGKIYVSSDFGNTWAPKESDRHWFGVAMSSDGKFQTTGAYDNEKIYVSSDFGNTWSSKEANRNWVDVAMSSDGRIQTALDRAGQIYVSTDSGDTWTAKDSDRYWNGIDMSSDGKIQTAIVSSGSIYISTDSGNTWVPKESNRDWYGIAMSSDGKTQIASAKNGQIYLSCASETYSCTGSVPSGSTMCANDNTGLTAALPWQSIGTSASSCTEARKCEYYTSTNSYSCTGTAPDEVTQIACPDDKLDLASDLPWTNVGTTSGSCTQARKCEYYVPSAYSCTGTLPSNSIMCANDNTDLTATLPWQSVGSAASSCTEARKCEYYLSNVCTKDCSGTALTCQAIQPDKSSLFSEGECCGDGACYECQSGYYWNTRTCSPISSNCDLSASLFATPTSGSAPLEVDLEASIQAVFGPVYCDGHDCGGGTISNVDGCDFTCTYEKSGNYKQTVHVANPGCAKDPSATVTVEAGSTSCASEMCQGNSCWDGQKYIPGTKTEGCATVSATANPSSLTVPATTYLKWSTVGGSKMEMACLSGPKIMERGGWFLSDADCKNSGKAECTEDGYALAFNSNQIGEELCTFYPYNSSNGKPGTPTSVEITAKASTINCGTAMRAYSATETDWGTYTFCTAGTVDPTNPTFPVAGGSTTWICDDEIDSYCTATRSSSGAPQSGGEDCRVDNPGCNEPVCQDLYCFDGCTFLQGKLDCVGQQ